MNLELLVGLISIAIYQSIMTGTDIRIDSHRLD